MEVKIEINKVKKRSLFNKTNSLYKFLIQICLKYRTRQDKSKLHEQISKLLYLNCNGSLIEVT